MEKFKIVTKNESGGEYKTETHAYLTKFEDGGIVIKAKPQAITDMLRKLSNGVGIDSYGYVEIAIRKDKPKDEHATTRPKYSAVKSDLKSDDIPF